MVDAQSYNQPPGGPDTEFNPALVINDAIHNIALQPDGKILAAGGFTTPAIWPEAARTKRTGPEKTWVTG